ncbi:MAG: hypothetical protein WBD87_12745 [Candidatus Acidiferrales bacterium]
MSVSVSPQSASVLLGQTVQFMATVTGVSSSAVNWSVNNVAGGNSTVGTISASGLYTAPRAMPSASNVTVTATAQPAPQASGSATVQIQSGTVGGGNDCGLRCAANAAPAEQRHTDGDKPGRYGEQRERANCD